jgi:hypothetical protein
MAITMAVSVAGVTIAGVAVDSVARGASFDAAKIGLAAAIETMQSGSTIETRGTTGDVARRSAHEAAGRKASERSGRRTTERRTTDSEARRRTSEARRGPGGGPGSCASAALGTTTTAPSNTPADRVRRVFADIVCLLRSRAVAEQ